MWTAVFWKDLAERALKTFLQGFLVLATPLIVAGQYDLLIGAAGAAAAMTGVSVLTSLASALKGDPATASLVSGPPGPVRRLG